jgi:hypothetical protein
MKRNLRNLFLILAFSIFISIPLLVPYFHSGYFPTHDGEWAVVRLADMFRELRDFQIPPRFSGNLNFGYGYPLFNFAYPFPYYLGFIIYILGFGLVDSIKIVFVLSILISAFFMFLASRNIWKNDYAGIISSVLYLYFPYRLVDLFVRGSIGESVAFAIFPIILYCLSKLIDKPKNYGYILAGGILFACLILTHNIMAVLFSISLFIFFVGNYITQKNKIIFPFASVVGLGFILSAYFWIPALLEKKNILLSKVPISDRNLYFVSLDRFLFSNWGYGVPTDPKNSFTYQLGWPFLGVLGLVLGSAIYNFRKKIKDKQHLILAISLLVGILIYAVLMFEISKPVWKLPLLSEINYPWIILSQLALLSSILAGYLASFKLTKYLAIGLVILALFLNIPNAKPETYVNRGDGHYLTNDATTTSSNELMPLWVKSHPVQRANEKVEFVKGEGEITNLSSNSKSISFDIKSQENSTIRINTIYYPGWKIYINEKEIPINYSNNFGLIEINVPEGISNIKGNFSETSLRLIADLISLIGMIVVVIVFSKVYLLKLIKR